MICPSSSIASVDEEERLSLRSKLENDLEVATERMDTLVRGMMAMMSYLFGSVDVGTLCEQ